LQVGQSEQAGQAGQGGRFTYFPHKQSKQGKQGKRGKRSKSVSGPVGQPHCNKDNHGFEPCDFKEIKGQQTLNMDQ